MRLFLLCLKTLLCLTGFLSVLFFTHRSSFCTYVSYIMNSNSRRQRIKLRGQILIFSFISKGACETRGPGEECGEDRGRGGPCAGRTVCGGLECHSEWLGGPESLGFLQGMEGADRDGRSHGDKARLHLGQDHWPHRWDRIVGLGQLHFRMDRAVKELSPAAVEDAPLGLEHCPRVCRTDAPLPRLQDSTQPISRSVTSALCHLIFILSLVLKRFQCSRPSHLYSAFSVSQDIF